MSSVYPALRRSAPHSPAALPLKRAADYQAAVLRRLQPVNENSLYKALTVRKELRGVAGILRIGGRLVPYLSALILAYELYRFWQYAKGSEGYDMTGWTHVCGSGGGGTLVGFAQPCGTINANMSLSNYNAKLGKLSGFPSQRYAYFWEDVHPHPVFPNSIMVVSQNDVWRNDAVYDPPVPPYRISPSVIPPAVPNVSPLPSIDPAFLPIGEPVSHPAPIPYRLLPRMRPNPWRHHAYQRTAGNYPPDSTLDPYFPFAPTIPSTSLPFVTPPVVVEPVSGTASYRAYPMTVAREQHKLDRARRNEREKKIKMQGSLGVLALLNAASEAVDLVDCIYDAIPRKYRPRYGNTRFVLRHPTPQQKVLAIYQHFDKIDIPKALGNVVSNEIEDRIFGKLGNLSKNVSHGLRVHGDLPIGLQAGRAL